MTGPKEQQWMTSNGYSPPLDFSPEGIVRAQEPEDGAALLTAIVAVVRDYVQMTKSQAITVALWVVHTHAIEAAEATPYLAVTSAEKRSGKTRLQEIVEKLVARPIATHNTSDAALFRSISEVEPPTLLFDEADAVFGPKARDREDLRAMLNAGYRRGSFARRCVGEGKSQRVAKFPVFCPKMIAAIGRLPDTVADRSISIKLKRRRADEKVRRFRQREAAAETHELRERISRWTLAHVDRLRDDRPEIPGELNDRAADGWEPLLAIADLAGWDDEARRAAKELSGGAIIEDDSWGIQLLADIRRIYEATGADRFHTTDLLEELRDLSESPWAGWGKGDGGLNARALAKLLRQYDIRSRSVRTGEDVAKGYQREWFEDAWERYPTTTTEDEEDAAPPQTASQKVTRVTSASDSQKPGEIKGLQEENVTLRKQSANPHPRAVVTHVTPEKPFQGKSGVQADDSDIPF